MSNLTSFFRNFFSVSFVSIFNFLRVIVTIPILIKTLGEEGYGSYIILTSIFSLIHGISSFGVGFRAQRYLPSAQERETKQTLFLNQFFFQFISLFILGSLFFFLFPFLQKGIFKEQFEFSPGLVFPYLFSYYLFAQGADFFRYTHRINLFNLSTIAFPIIFLSITVLCFTSNCPLSLSRVIIIHIIAATIVAIPLFSKIAREIHFTPTFPQWSEFLQDLRLGFPLLLGYLVDVVLSSSDRYLIGWLISVKAVGEYSPAYAIGSFIILVPKGLGVVLPPMISRAVDQGKEDEAQLLLNTAIKVFFVLSIPFIVGSFFLGKPILSLLANPNVGQNAFLVIPIVAVASVFYGVNSILSTLLFVRLKTMSLFKINFISSVLNLFLNLIFLGVFKDIHVAAITTLLSYLIISLHLYKIVSNEWDFSISAAEMLRCISSAVFMGFFLFGMAHFEIDLLSWGKILTQLFLGVIMYFTATILFKVFSYRELLWLKSVFINHSPKGM